MFLRVGLGVVVLVVIVIFVDWYIVIFKEVCSGSGGGVCNIWVTLKGWMIFEKFV